MRERERKGKGNKGWKQGQFWDEEEIEEKLKGNENEMKKSVNENKE